MLEIWRNGKSKNYPLTKALKNKFKPLLIFVKINTIKEEWGKHQPFEDRMENRIIHETFEVHSMPAPDPVLEKGVNNGQTEHYEFKDLD